MQVTENARHKKNDAIEMQSKKYLSNHFKRRIVYSNFKMIGNVGNIGTAVLDYNFPKNSCYGTFYFKIMTKRHFFQT